MAGGLSWVSPSGDELGESDVAELGLPELGGILKPDYSLGAANNDDGFSKAQRAVVAAAVRRAIARLRASSTCSALLGPAAPDVLNQNSYTGFWNANPGMVATAGGGAIHINVNGYFFGGSALSWAIVGGVSVADYQMITLLHEVGHEVMALAPDNGDTGASMINTIQVTSHCGPWPVQ
jgi:hypothetical protein